MHQTKLIITFWALVFILQSCIIPFTPQIDPGDINKYVVSGQVTDFDKYQTVRISMASPVGNPEYVPVSGCAVRIFDDKGHEFAMNETEAGVYKGEIDSDYLLPGISFRLEIVASDGTVIESDYEQMNECPEVDKVYFLRKDIYSDKPYQGTKGIQFYLDLDGSDSKTRNFRWEAIETWEYHVEYPREWYYDGSVHHIDPPDYSRMVCWSTVLVKDIFTLSTANLTENKFEQLPLNYVDNHSDKLIYGYSLLVKQYALSEAAYYYWDQMKTNGFEQGGLYERQPLSITGNLYNKTDPSQKVLGYFSASCVKTKRIFIKDLEDFEIDFVGYCSPFSPRYGFRELNPSDYPTFLMGDSHGWFMVFLNNECVDCLTIGGTNIKPDYWPY